MSSVHEESEDDPASLKDFQMNKTHAVTAIFKDAMVAFPIDTSAAQSAFKSSAELNEKISTVALTAVEKSRVISQQWTQDSLKNLPEVSKAKTAPPDYIQAMTDFAAEFSESATEHMVAFTDIAKAAQAETVELMMAACKSFGEEATSGARTSDKDATSASKTVAAK
jgi:hypothetical protein